MGGRARVVSIVMILGMATGFGPRTPLSCPLATGGDQARQVPLCPGRRWAGCPLTLVLVRIERVVIAGAGLAGLRTVEELRGRGYPGAITMVGAEPRPP